MASVRKREWEYNGVKKSAWVVEYTDPSSGNRKRFTPKSGLKKDAEKERLRIENEVEAGIHTASSKSPLIADLCDDFMRIQDSRLRDGRIVTGTHYKIRTWIDSRLRPKWARTKLEALSDLAVADWYEELRSSGLSTTTARQLIRMMGQIELMAFKRGYTKRKVFPDALADLRGIQRAKIKTFTTDQVRAILEATNVRAGHRWRNHMMFKCFVNIAALCGLRIGEIRGLKRSSVDFENKVIKIRHSIDSTWKELKGPKTRAGNRNVPLPGSIAIMIKEYMQLFFVENDDDLIFLSPNGLPIASRVTGVLWGNLLKRAGIKEHINFHALRHFAASWMIENRIPLTEVATLMGHNTFDMTLQVYSHTISGAGVGIQSMRDAIDALDTDLMRTEDTDLKCKVGIALTRKKRFGAEATRATRARQVLLTD